MRQRPIPARAAAARRAVPAPPAAVLLALLLGLAAAASAAATVTEPTLTVSPPGLTWRDPIRVELAGTSDCVVGVEDTRVTTEGGAGTIFIVEIGEGCILDPPTPLPFSVEAEFPPQRPGDYTLRVVEDGVGTVLQMPFTVAHEADLLIEPELPATDAEPLIFHLTLVASSCHGEIAPQVDGNVITVTFLDDCPILPPGPSILSPAYAVGPLEAGDYEIVAYRNVQPSSVATLPVHVYAADGCVPADDVLCLGGGRFQVQVDWQDFQGGSGSGQAIPLPDRDETGLFWFFNPANVELTVKVLDGCPVNGHYWVFLSSGSTVEYTITVTDTEAGETRIYHNDLGETPVLVPDTGAFATCP